MDWVEGMTLDKYIREHIADQYELSLLAYQFSRLAMWLMPQPFAHGDLKPDNILVKDDGSLVLVDYDGMYVPAMKGQKARELGSPDFRHPFRTENDFDEHIDDFSLASILLSLKAIALHPDLLEQYGASDRLLFSEKDYRNLSVSKVMDALKPLMQDTELTTLYSLFTLSSAQNNLSQTSFRLLNLSRPQYISNNVLNDERMGLGYVDLGLSVKWATCNLGAKEPEEYGDYFKWGDDIPKKSPSSDKPKKSHLSYNSKYNASDRKKILVPEDDTATILLGCHWRMPTIEEFKELKEKCVWKEECLNGVKGCRVIGPNGKSIFLPFAGNYDVGFPFNAGHGVYWSSTAYVEDNLTFNNSWYLYFKNEHPTINYYDRSSANTIRPVMVEGEDLSTQVTEEDLVNAWTDEFGVIYSSDRRRLLKINDYLWEKDEWTYLIYQGTKVICDHAFHPWKSSYRNCGTSSIVIPDSVITIGESAFMGIGLSSIIIPKSVRKIGYSAFAANTYLESIIVAEENPFFDSRNNCNAIIKTENNELVIGCKSTIIPYGVTTIGREAFSNCYNLKALDIPDGVTSIKEKAFSFCENLRSINLAQSVTTIGDSVFEGCPLTYIVFGDNISSIGNNIFDSFRFKRIYAPKSTQNRIQELTPEYNKYFDETVSTDYDFINAWTDMIGAKYSADRKRLLKVPKDIKNYSVKEGTIVICNNAFGGIWLMLSCLSKNKKAESLGVETITIPNTVEIISKKAFYGCSNIKFIYIPLGSKKKFEKLLLEYKDKLVEKSNVVSITFDSCSTSKVDRCRVFQKNNDWKLEVVYKNGKKIEKPHSLLQGNQSIVFDKQTIEKIQLYVGYCEGFYINPKAVKIDFEYPAKYIAKILFDSDYIEISGISWGLNNNINEWKVKGLRTFNIEERLAVKRAEVVSSQYGYSVCFFMNAGGQTYIPLDTNSGLCVGDELDMNTAKIVTLCREGKDDIVRIIE